MELELDRKEIIAAMEAYVAKLFPFCTAVAQTTYSFPSTMTFKICLSDEESKEARALEGDDD